MGRRVVVVGSLLVNERSQSLHHFVDYAVSCISSVALACCSTHVLSSCTTSDLFFR